MSHSSRTANHTAEKLKRTVEPDYVETGAVYRFGLGLTVIVIVSQILMYWMMNAGVARVDAANPPRTYPLGAVTQDIRPPAPRLQDGVMNDNGGRLLQPSEVPDRNLSVREALQELRAEEEATLTSFRWIDRNNQIVGIPVADAMKLTVQRGLASRPQNAREEPAAASSATQEPK